MNVSFVTIIMIMIKLAYISVFDKRSTILGRECFHPLGFREEREVMLFARSWF